MLISHEWIESTGGSENVFRGLLELFPGADAACLWNNMPHTFDRPVSESWLARTPMRGRKAASLPLVPSAWRRMDVTRYDTVLASSHAFGHQLATHAVRRGKRGLAYVHTPARYLWAPEVEPRGDRASLRLAAAPLKALDRRLVDPRVRYAANSRYVRDRIRRSWGVDAEVIYPPVDIERIVSVERWGDVVSAEEAQHLSALPEKAFLLGASRLVSYKRLDRVIDLGNRLDMPVAIAGAGPGEAELRAHADSARVPVTFLGRVTDEMLYALYQRAALFVFLAVEDFGIMPVEAMAAGTPVLVNADGGASESMRAVGGGIPVHGSLSTPELAVAAAKAMSIEMAAVPKACRQFSRQAFGARVEHWVTRS
ncbi:glycosyltransferase [Nocardioides sp. BP30]|uniref:glycosyltransferase n=1 Tax=Nocardioides sp. BP30 TaxID=3036374 RepID=UPI00246938BA|nr:glycosyltransferase [Nocardioides sp. BP30]WGL54242.1 glycosyltransferase [Nocardioides sp. BP30]